MQSCVPLADGEEQAGSGCAGRAVDRRGITGGKKKKGNSRRLVGEKRKRESGKEIRMTTA